MPGAPSTRGKAPSGPGRPSAAPAVAAALAAVLAACAPTPPGGSGAGEGGSVPGPPGSASVEWAGLRFRFSLRPSPADRIRIRAEVTNVSGHVREAEVPWCLVRLRLAREGAVVFDRARTEECGGGVRILRLADGEARRFRAVLTAAEVLGDSLRPGRFAARVRLAGAGGRPGPPRAEMELLLGTVELSRP